MTADTASLQAGIELLAAGRFQEALAPLRAALSLGDTSPYNAAEPGDRRGSRRRQERGRQLMRQVAVRLPDWDEPMLRLAESLRAAGERPAAEEAYRHVLKLNPNRAEALIALSGLLLMREQPEAARTLLNSLLQNRAGQRRGLEHAGPGVARS